jgi:hypothetical protein
MEPEHVRRLSRLRRQQGARERAGPAEGPVRGGGERGPHGIAGSLLGAGGCQGPLAAAEGERARERGSGE